MVSGRSVSRVKYLIGWGLPSSRMVKSFCSRLGTRLFLLVADGSQNVDHVYVHLDGGHVVGKLLLVGVESAPGAPHPR